MIAVNGWCAGGKGGGGGREKGGECSVNGEGGGRLLSKLSPTVLPDAVLPKFEMKNVGSL